MANDLEVRRTETTAAGLLMIVSGALTAGAAFTIVATLGWYCVGFLWLVPMFVGMAEVVIGANLIGSHPRSTVRSLSAAGLLAALLSGNLIGVLLEIAVQVLLARTLARDR